MRKQEQRLWAALLIFSAASLLVGGGVLYSRLGGGGRPVEISLPQAGGVTAGQKDLVYVGGQVFNPGFYPLREGDSLASLLQAAGGAAPGADVSRIWVHVPQAGEDSLPQRIDLNKAEAWLLQALPGIGEKRARDIVRWRESNGPFRNTEELMKVEGLGPETYEKLKDFITVWDEPGKGLHR